MKYKIALLEEAIISIDSIAENYNKKEFGLGKRFKSSVREMLLKIKEHPEIFQETGNNQRRAVLRSSFPYSIHYFIDKGTKTIQIARVFHQHRNYEQTQELLKLDRLHSIKREKVMKQRLKQLEKDHQEKELYLDKERGLEL